MLEYFIPGYLFIRILSFLISYKTSDNIVIVSVIISYILNCVLYPIIHFILLWTHIPIEHIITNNTRCFFVSVFAIILAIGLAKIYELKFINRILSIFSYKSINNSVWRDYIDFDKGDLLYITCQNGNTYVGFLDYLEENGLDSWFVLKRYSVSEKNDIELSATNIYPNARLFVNLKNVERIELFNPNDRNIKEQT